MNALNEGDNFNCISALSNCATISILEPAELKAEQLNLNHSVTKIANRNIFIKEFPKSLLCLGTGIFLSERFTKYNAWNLGREILDVTQFCPSSIFPKGTTEFFDKYINYPKWLNVTDGSDVWMNCVYGPMFEEIVDRVLLQEYLLKRIPEKILKKVSPQHAYLVNAAAAKIIRVSISSIFFALHHSWAHNCTSGDMYPYLLAGGTLGALQEIAGHPLYSMIAHTIGNLSGSIDFEDACNKFQLCKQNLMS